jgi:RNA polymerase sigma-70 factor (ECF subfamily)
MMDSMSDQQLVRSCLQGDVDEYQKIVEKYRAKAMAIAMNILRNREDAEDACQEAFIQVYQNLERYDVKQSFSNWLYSILSKRCLDRLRKRKRFANFYRKLKTEPSQSFSMQPSNSSALTVVREKVMRYLNPKERITLFLWADEGYTSAKEYRMTLSVVPNEFKMSSDPTKKGAVYQIKIGILEQHREKKINLLDTEIILPHQKNVVLGFENREGTPYFLSFHVVKPPPPPPPPPAPPPAPPSPPSPPPPPPKDIQQIKEEIREFERGAVRCVGEIEPPKLIKKVEPVYPEDAKKAKVSGVVILGVRTDKQGHVKNAMVYKSKDPLLVQPSIDAVKQWEYEPLYVKGEPADAVFTVTVTFKLEEEAMVGGAVGGVIELKDLEKPPKLIKKVDPVYPEEAKKQGIQGVVVIEATTDEQGNVIQTEILKSESSLLNQPAVDALRQWKYEPVYKEGKPVGITFTVTITFKLK